MSYYELLFMQEFLPNHYSNLGNVSAITNRKVNDQLLNTLSHNEILPAEYIILPVKYFLLAAETKLLK